MLWQGMILITMRINSHSNENHSLPEHTETAFNTD